MDFTFTTTHQRKNLTMLIREVILENFMSYEYARIPFKPGVNVICGPNGAGKSSILLGISVALGQSYTERSKKLSDLIRWGQNQARITLVLDNSKRSGKRPVRRFNKDEIFLTRVLRKDGKYWFELENRAASKAEVRRLLGKLGVDPDNMLVIMHQNMVEQFAMLSPQEKLRMVEAAVGLEPYRRNVVEARKKLSRILSQEESLNKLLESAEQTLNYWREQYDRYQEKKQLQMRRNFLERELAWAKVVKREEAVEDLKKQLREVKMELNQIRNQLEKTSEEITNVESALRSLKDEWKKSVEERLKLEREFAKHELNIQFANQTMSELRSLIELSQQQIRACLKQIESSFQSELPKTNSKIVSWIGEIEKVHRNLEEMWKQQLSLKSESYRKVAENSSMEFEKLKKRIAEVQTAIDSLYKQIENENEKIVDLKIESAILNYKEEDLSRKLKELEKSLRSAEAELREALKNAESFAPRIVPTKSIGEILDEIRVTDGHLAALADVSEDIERMYERYSKLYLELKEKAKLVAENREKALEEVKTRMEAWRTVISKLLDRVNVQFQTILSQLQAVGEVRFVNENDIEAAGIEIFVGFKGANLVPLDAYTQSGGERSTAIMSFLLALQQHVRSPFRAVDEYDIHMDAKNRELIAQVLVSSVRNLGVQYVVITPRTVVFPEDVHIITVQNVEGTSIIREVV